MVDPVLVGGAVAAAGVVVAAAYAYLSGDDASAGVDVDGDGEDDVSYTFEGNDSEQESTFGIEEAGGTSLDEEPLSYQAAPEEVRDIGTNLAEVTGIGDTRADDLKKAGFHNASDLYFASDEELKSVSGIGDLTVSQIRGDIGSVEDEAAGNSSDTDESSETDGENDGSSSTDETESNSADDTTSSTDGESTDSTADDGSESTSSDE